MKKLFILILLILLVLSGCSSDTIKTQLYQGKNLVIGVIGNAPVVREDNIRFETIGFNDLEKVGDLSSEFDAILIMKEHLSEASEAKYAKVYKDSGIPFFFIESEKSYIPFIEEDILYEEVPEVKDQTYATGYFQSGEKGEYWGYGLYNDKVNESNIQDVYSRIFSTIESIRK